MRTKLRRLWSGRRHPSVPPAMSCIPAPWRPSSRLANARLNAYRICWLVRNMKQVTLCCLTMLPLQNDKENSPARACMAWEPVIATHGCEQSRPERRR